MKDNCQRSIKLGVDMSIRFVTKPFYVVVWVFMFTGTCCTYVIMSILPLNIKVF